MGEVNPPEDLTSHNSHFCCICIAYGL